MYAITATRHIMDYEPREFVQNFSLIGEDLKKLLSGIYLHKGRTDENGGHHDWLNRMGWGFGHYHYHHKLYAHLHPNGVCPYGALKASIINPFTGKKINLGTPYYYEDNPYFSLNLVSKALTAEDKFGANLGLGTGINPSFPGGSFYACPAGNSSIDDGLGEQLSFTYPKNILGFVLNNTFFKTDCGKLQLLCHNKQAEADDAICYAYVSLEAIREYMMKDDYFTNFSDNGSGVWSFTVRKPSVKITYPNSSIPSFSVGDTLMVKADIDKAVYAKLIVGQHTETKDTHLNQSEVEFSDYTLTNKDIGNLTLKVEVNTGGTAIGAETVTSTVQIQVEGAGKVTDLNSTGYNMIANMERNLSLIEYDEITGLITSIPTTSTDVGYGHDYIKNPLPSIPASMTASEAYELLKKDLKGIEPDGEVVKHKDYIGAIAGIDADFTQDQFNALVGLRYNIGKLGVIDGLLEYLEKGSYERAKLKDLINSYYDAIIISNPDNEKYKDGWYNRTEKMLDIFFDGNYGYMPIDAVNGKVILK